MTERLGCVPQNRRFYFGNEPAERPGADFQGAMVRVQLSEEQTPDDEYFDLAGSRLNDASNIQNAMAAILAARLMGCPADGVRKAIEKFTPLAHRLTAVAEINGVTYFDDSKATNIGAVYSALCAMKQPVVLIAGGKEKGTEYSMLNDLMQEKVKVTLLIGEAREKMTEAFRKLTRVEVCDSLEEAVSLAGEIAESGDAVLLSPACASFDMFTGYDQRGEIFSKAVMELGEKGALH